MRRKNYGDRVKNRVEDVTDEVGEQIHRHRVAYGITLVMFLLMLGTLYYSKAENWGWIDSLYFSTMTLTTIGYGDFAPTNPFTKLFTCFYALFGLGTMLYLLGTVMGGFVYAQEQYFERIVERVRNIREKLRYHLPEEEEGGMKKRYRLRK